MLSNGAWGSVEDIQAEVERRLAENKPAKSQPLPFARYLHVADTALGHVRPLPTLSPPHSMPAHTLSLACAVRAC